MKAIFIPDYSRANPYQKALADSLSKEGVEVSFGTISRLFSVLSSVKNHWKPNILHIHWPHPFLLASSGGKTILKSFSFIGELLILKLFGIKVVWTVHNITNLEGKCKYIELFFCKLIARLCGKLIVHCPSAKNEVMNAYGMSEDSRVVVIPHGSYIHSYENVISREQARKQLQLHIEDVVFLCFGLIRSYRGVSELVEAFKKLDAPRAKLLIAGKPYNAEIATDILERCHKNETIKTVFKFIPYDKVQIYVNVADVVVYTCNPSFFSPSQMPGGVILAMSFGKPVIAPALGCIPDVLDSEGSFLYDPSEKDGLLKAMQQALDTNTGDLVKIGKHNFELAKKLDWDWIANKIYNVYQECLKRKR